MKLWASWLQDRTGWLRRLCSQQLFSFIGVYEHWWLQFCMTIGWHHLPRAPACWRRCRDDHCWLLHIFPVLPHGRRLSPIHSASLPAGLLEGSHQFVLSFPISVWPPDVGACATSVWISGIGLSEGTTGTKIEKSMKQWSPVTGSNWSGVLTLLMMLCCSSRPEPSIAALWEAH